MIYSTYNPDECMFLLKDLTDVMSSTSLEEKEAQIRAGASYSEFITDEKAVSEHTIQIFKQLRLGRPHALQDRYEVRQSGHGITPWIKGIENSE